MKGRGARTIAPADFQSVTPDATAKTRFVIVDAVGVTEHAFVEPPLNRDKGVSLKKLLDKATTLSLTEDETATLASRLAKLELELTAAERGELDGVASMPVRDIVRSLVDAVDPDTPKPRRPRTRPIRPPRSKPCSTQPSSRSPPTPNYAVASSSCAPPTTGSSTRSTRTPSSTPTGSSTPATPNLSSSPGPPTSSSTATRSPRYSSPPKPRERRVGFADIQELADRISRPPYNWTPDLIWDAYAAVDVDRVRRSDRHTLTDLVSLLRFTVGVDQELVPYVDLVRERYAAWLAQQEQAGTSFSPLERWWLDRMVEVIGASAGITAHDLDEAPFTEKGGVDGALRDLGDRVGALLAQLNTELTA